MKPYLLLPAFAAVSLFAADPPEPKFDAVTIDDKIQIGYGVAVADVDGDRHPDILLADKKQIRLVSQSRARGKAADTRRVDRSTSSPKISPRRTTSASPRRTSTATANARSPSAPSGIPATPRTAAPSST